MQLAGWPLQTSAAFALERTGVPLLRSGIHRVIALRHWPTRDTWYRNNIILPVETTLTLDLRPGKTDTNCLYAQ
jgi:hypothetical protein